MEKFCFVFILRNRAFEIYPRLKCFSLNFWLIYSPLMPGLHICKSLARSRPFSRGFKRASWSMTDVESATFYYYVLVLLWRTHLQRKYTQKGKKEIKK